MTKADIVDRISETLDIPKAEAQQLMESTFDLFKEGIIETHMVKIPGFGNFCIKSKGPRIGRNPQSGETMEIAARKVLLFKPSEKLKKRFNNAEL